MNNVHAVILAGGSGTRFWPASRRLRPKQLLPLAGNSGQALIEATLRRIEPLVPVDHVWISTGAHLIAATAAVLPQVSSTRFLAEPVARNTAPCIGLATATIARQDPEAVLAVLPADHYIANEPEFRAVLVRAIEAARKGWLVTVGIVPTRPETGYGYIEVGEPIEDGAWAVARFIEKPARERAEALVRGGRHLWNAGMFFFRASVMREAIRKHLPALSAGLDALDSAASRGDETHALAELFPSMQSISIDHGVMEKADRIAVVPGDFGWNDVGSFEVTWEMANKDPQGNVVPDGAVAVDSTNNLVLDLTSGAPEPGSEGAVHRHGEARLRPKTWALVGVHDLVLVETDDAVLVIPRERAQDVRLAVNALSSRGETNRL